MRCGFQEGKNPTVPNRTEPIEKPAPYKTLKFCPLVQPIKRNRIGRSWFKLKDGNDLPHEYRLHYLLECHIFTVVCWPLWTVEEGGMTSFFVQDLLCRTGASGENVSPPTTALQKGKKWSGVSVGNNLLFLPERVDCRYWKHACKKHHGIIRRSDCVRPISNHI